MKEKLQRVRIIGIHRKEYTCVREEGEMMKKRVECSLYAKAALAG